MLTLASLVNKAAFTFFSGVSLCLSACLVSDQQASPARLPHERSTKPARDACQKVWHLKQQSTNAGMRELFVCQNSLKIIDRVNKVSLYASKPDWRFFVVSDAQMSISEADENSSFMHAPLPLQAILLARLQGLRVIETVDCNYKGVPAQSLRLQARVLKASEVSRDLQIASADYCVTDRFGLPAGVCRRLCRYYLVPLNDRFPLRFACHTDINHLELSTSECKEMELPKTFFRLPAGYKHIHNGAKSSSIDPHREMIDRLLNSFR